MNTARRAALGLPRPARVSRQTLALAAIALALYGIARMTGSGWAVVVLAGLVGLLVVAAVLPITALVGIDVEVTAPGWGIAGRPLPLEVSVRTRVGGLRLAPVVPPGAFVHVTSNAAGPIETVPPRRGVIDHIELELRSAAPLGLYAWRRTATVALDPVAEIGPDPLPASRRPPPTRGSRGAESPTFGGSEDDIVRGAREYAAGDPLRLVHWPATARTGELMVKELEAPASPALAIIVDLSGNPVDAEEAAGRAATLALDAIAAGIAVTLLTSEADGAAVGRVGTLEDVERRLARTVAAPPPSGPLPANVDVLRVTADGDG